MTPQNLYKLVGVTYISICLKNLLQIIFATLFITDGDLHFYSLRDENIYSLKTIFLYIFLYDFLIFSLFYIAVFFFLYYIIKIFGNKILIHIAYVVLIYSSAMFIREHGNFHIEYIIIPIILGCANWWMVKKWMQLS